MIGYFLGGEKRRPEIGPRSQASYETNIKKNVGRGYTSARLFRIKNVFPSLSDLPGYTPELLITK